MDQNLQNHGPKQAFSLYRLINSGIRYNNKNLTQGPCTRISCPQLIHAMKPVTVQLFQAGQCAGGACPASRSSLSSVHSLHRGWHYTGTTHCTISLSKCSRHSWEEETTFSLNPSSLIPLYKGWSPILLQHWPSTLSRSLSLQYPSVYASHRNSSLLSSRCCKLFPLSLKKWELLSSLAFPHPSPGSITRVLS